MWDSAESEVQEILAWMNSFGPNRRTYFEDLGEGKSKNLPSVQQAQKLELKPLPSHLKYAYLGEADTLPIIMATGLSIEEEDKLLRILRKYKGAIGWTLADLKGISPSVCMHKILLEDECNPTVEHQRRLNLAMKKVV